MKYIQITSAEDKDIPYLLSIHKLPEISRYIHIDEENYFRYVSSTENVFYYKVYNDNNIVATAHCELLDDILFLSLLVIPRYQNRKIGTKILDDIQNGVLPLTFSQIKVSIEKSNMASLHLFSKMNFIKVSEDDELMDFVSFLRKG